MPWIRQRALSDPSGVRWSIGRRWSLWQPRHRRIQFDGADLPDPTQAFDTDLDSPFDAVMAVVALVIVGFLLVVVLGPLAGVGIFFAEWLLVLLLVPLAVAYRIVFRRPWQLYAIKESGDGFLARVAGWTASSQMLDRAVHDIRQSGRPQAAEWTPTH